MIRDAAAATDAVSVEFSPGRPRFTLLQERLSVGGVQIREVVVFDTQTGLTHIVPGSERAKYGV